MWLANRTTERQLGFDDLAAVGHNLTFSHQLQFVSLGNESSIVFFDMKRIINELKIIIKYKSYNLSLWIVFRSCLLLYSSNRTIIN